MSQRREKAVKISGILILLAVAVIALVNYASRLDRQLREQIKTNLRGIAAQNVFILQQEVDRQMEALVEIAQRIGDDEKNDMDAAVRVLKEVTQRHPFKRMGIADLKGEARTTDGVSMNIFGRSYFQKSLKGESAVSIRLKDYVDGESILVFSTPVYFGEDVASILFATYDIREFARILSHVSSSTGGDFCVVGADGDIIVSSVLEVKEERPNIYQALSGLGELNSGLLQDLARLLENGSGGELHIQAVEDCYLQISPLAVNDWYLLSFVPVSIMDKTHRHIMGMTYVLCFGIGLMITAFVFVLFRMERRRYRELERVLYVDPLTKGYSHQKFMLEAGKKLAASNQNAAFLVMDIDQFKLVNELFGRQKGDEVLCYLSDCWAKWVRKDELYARRIADRFNVLAFYESREELIGRIQCFMEHLRKESGEKLKGYVLNPRIGVYLIEDKSEELENIHNNAVMAHSSIKSSSPVSYAVYDREFKKRTLENKILEDQMEAAYRKDEFVAYYQPKFDAGTGRLTGAEALVRWLKPDGTLIPPGGFIPLAEKRGFITKLDKLMFRQVCGQLRAWQEAGMDLVPVSVNLSREHLKDVGFIREYAEMMEQSGISPDFVELELTESALFENMEVTREVVDELHRRGIRILMDDFGTGYSSLMMLKSIPIDVMKLDKSFVDDYNDLRGEKVIECVVGLAGALHIDVTAEGVETREQYEFFRDLGCDSIQGFYFARPMPADDFGCLLKASAQKGRHSDNPPDDAGGEQENVN